MDNKHYMNTYTIRLKKKKKKQGGVEFVEL